MARSRKAQGHLFSASIVLLAASQTLATPLYGVSFGTSQDAVLYDVHVVIGVASNPRPVGLGHVVGIASRGCWRQP
ncbi:MAG: hypothetical protein ACUVXJ_12020 [Phycisphaerae bacterium]